ncbi:hypothetical protein MANES_01G158400v8 [Manihot esculenta]|uniref:Uncharacterized protein n=1 Tax=Manihot esculenta TaxID=3983 RepID=A0A2C9WL24_MANES|nr:hypothetical protein MANES_01G158400v8 [Manihot esculenta]
MPTATPTLQSSGFEYVNQSIFYDPLLGFFAFTSIPTSEFCGSSLLKLEAEKQDRRGGYL